MGIVKVQKSETRCKSLKSKKTFLDEIAETINDEARVSFRLFGKGNNMKIIHIDILRGMQIWYINKIITRTLCLHFQIL